MKAIYTIKEYAEEMNISSTAVYKKIDKLETITYKKKKHILVDKEVETKHPQSPQLKQIEVEKIVYKDREVQVEVEVRATSYITYTLAILSTILAILTILCFIEQIEQQNKEQITKIEKKIVYKKLDENIKSKLDEAIINQTSTLHYNNTKLTILANVK